MSFSSEVKEELLTVAVRSRHCQLAEIAAMISGCGRIYRQDGQLHVTLATENSQVVQRYASLLQQATDLSQGEAVRALFQMLKITDSDGRQIRENLTLTDGRLLQKSCCKRAFLRGAFLAAGSMSNPKKSYHFEIVCGSQEQAAQLQEQFACFQLEAKTVCRKNHAVVYLKEGAQIVDALNIMGAHTALMDLENVRIIKEMRNDINRRVNCETANINKTVHAAYRQQEAIRFLLKQGALQGLSRQLQEMAQLRVEHPQATIRELSELCSPPVGRSGVNHRLRRLEEIAEQMGYGKRDDQS